MARSKEDKALFIAGLRAAAKALEEEGREIPWQLLQQFSFRNCCAILSQRPNATNCAGFHAWQAAGRKVSKGAKGIAILVPFSKNEGEDVIFTWRYVFDILDTEPMTAELAA